MTKSSKADKYPLLARPTIHLARAGFDELREKAPANRCIEAEEAREKRLVLDVN